MKISKNSYPEWSIIPNLTFLCLKKKYSDNKSTNLMNIMSHNLHLLSLVGFPMIKARKEMEDESEELLDLIFSEKHCLNTKSIPKNKSRFLTQVISKKINSWKKHISNFTIKIMKYSNLSNRTAFYSA